MKSKSRNVKKRLKNVSLRAVLAYISLTSALMIGTEMCQAEESLLFSDGQAAVDVFTDISVEEWASEVVVQGEGMVSAATETTETETIEIETTTTETATTDTTTTQEADFSVPATEWGYVVCVGDEVEMDVSISVNEGCQVTYQWYLIDENENKTLVEGVSGDTYTIVAEKDVRYCCLITDEKGNQQYVYFDIGVEGEQSSQDWTVFIDLELMSAVSGDNVVLTPTIDGREYSALTYQWYKAADLEEKTAIAGATSYTYTVQNVTSNDTYICVITDENGNQESVTFEIEMRVPELDTPVLDSVTSASGKKIKITWEALDNAEGYRVYRKTEGSKWTRLATLSEETLSYTDTTPTAGVVYTYSIRGFVEINGKRYFSLYAAAKTAVAKTAAAEVTTKQLAYNKVKVSWSKVADAKGYRVYRKVSGDTKWVKLKDVSSTTVTYTDSTVKPGIEYLYTVRGYCTSEGKKLWGQYNSKGASITTLTEAPKLVSAKSQGYNKIKVTWNVVGGANGYRVYRKTSDTSWKLLKNVSSATTSYVDTTAEMGVAYTYTVRSFCTVDGKKVLGSYDKTGLQATAKLSAPKLVSAKISSKTKTKITWKAVDGATGYRVYRKTSGGEWERLTTLASSTTLTYTDKTAKGKSYIYTVRAYRLVGEKKVWGSFSKTGITSAK